MNLCHDRGKFSQHEPFSLLTVCSARSQPVNHQNSDYTTGPVPIKVVALIKLARGHVHKDCTLIRSVLIPMVATNQTAMKEIAHFQNAENTMI